MWYVKFFNFIRQSSPLRLFRREPQVTSANQTGPRIIWQSEVLLQNRVHSTIIGGQSFCDLMKFTGRCKLRSSPAAMDYEG
jgi:hypothetical protein